MGIEINLGIFWTKYFYSSLNKPQEGGVCKELGIAKSRHKEGLLTRGLPYLVMYEYMNECSSSLHFYSHWSTEGPRDEDEMEIRIQLK